MDVKHRRIALRAEQLHTLVHLAGRHEARGRTINVHQRLAPGHTGECHLLGQGGQRQEKARAERDGFLPEAPRNRLCRAASAAPLEGGDAEGGAGVVHSIPEVVEREGQVLQFAADQRHRSLQVVALATGDAHGIALNGALHLQFAALDDLLDLLAVFGADAVAHLHHLLHLVATGFFHLADIEEAPCTLR
eukprot:TRINITY_DN15072_c0_g3_i2.p2 TRINITY_DN15072_c0_g3~~TRINITY_DN15072_c0_g3_i2.p2  ORF type:complete len:191 (+),score=32.75 TRINITY_DN15072_c0_g3_i2:198-770(+)